MFAYFIFPQNLSVPFDRKTFFFFGWFQEKYNIEYVCTQVW